MSPPVHLHARQLLLLILLLLNKSIRRPLSDMTMAVHSELPPPAL